MLDAENMLTSLVLDSQQQVGLILSVSGLLTVLSLRSVHAGPDLPLQWPTAPLDEVASTMVPQPKASAHDQRSWLRSVVSTRRRLVP